LDDLKQEVVKRRFGFDGQLAQDYEQIATVLTAALSPELRAEMAQDRGILASDVSISAQDVKHIETLALRSLRKPR
jgi:DNA-directed RNA polymerase sigma subunit (sigma70/sigma32)